MKSIHFPALIVLVFSLIILFIFIGGQPGEYLNSALLKEGIQEDLNQLTFQPSPELGTMVVLGLGFLVLAFSKHHNEKGALVIFLLVGMGALALFSGSLGSWWSHVQETRTPEADIGLLIMAATLVFVVFMVRTQNNLTLLLCGMGALALIVIFGSYEGQNGLYYQYTGH